VTKRTLNDIAKKTKAHGTKARISRQTGIALPYLSRILSGKRVPSEDKAEVLGALLGIEPSEFRKDA
jgi:transcriptional regulator with XRE-family HTH domain